MTTLRLTRADRDKTYSIRLGDRIVILLEETPSSGHVWQIEQQDETLLAEHQLDDDAGDDGPFGGSGMHRFAFEAVGVGLTQLKLILGRPWEDDAQILERYRVAFEIT